MGWLAFVSRQGLAWTGLLLAIFGCVLLHELGHALVARRYGIETRDITLYPIGGVAMLDGRPRPRQELWIALAGPAVNVVIAAILMAVSFAQGNGMPQFQAFGQGGSILSALFIANASLAIFNLLPAFPMDGGRVLRSLLAMYLPESRATQIAGVVGQAMAVAIGLFGFFSGSPILMVVAFFVFLGAGQEIQSSVLRSFLQGHPLRDAMVRRYRSISSGDTLETAARMLLAGSQHDFPIVAGNEVVGILTRNDIAEGLANDGPAAYVAGHMRREFKTAHPNVPLEMAMDMFTQDDPSPIVVMDEGEMVGLVTQENLGEFIMLAHARRQGPNNYGYSA